MDSLELHSATYTTNSTTKSISYLAAGPPTGPLLIFVHGWPGVAETWKPQLLHFASRGFRVLASDTPGYGHSTTTRVKADYSLESLIASQLALLADAGRDKAVWIGHDWGAVIVWSLAAHYPRACAAVANIAVPYNQIELGISQLLTTVNRDIYPVNEYPNGPWDYQVFYETNFDDAVRWMDSDAAGFAKLMYSRGSPEKLYKPAETAGVTKAGGRLGGAPAPIPEGKIALESTVLDEEVWGAVRAKMLKTGFWCANAYYSNHAANRVYTLEKRENGGVLEMPVLFIDTRYDTVCTSALAPKLSEPMRELCRDLTEEEVFTGHWGQLEKPEEVNGIVERWLKNKVAAYTGSG